MKRNFESDYPKYGTRRLDHFLTEEFSEQINSRRFRFGVFRKSISLRNVEDAQTPDDLLERVLDYLIKDAETNSPSKPEKFSVIIRNSLLEKPIQIPYRIFAQNTTEVILRQFDSVEQSRRRKGLPSLFSDAMHLEIVMGPSTDEIDEILNPSGQGRRRQNQPQIVRNIKSCSLIEDGRVADGSDLNRLCLFVAIELTRVYVALGANQIERNNFNKLVNGNCQYYQRKRQHLADLLLLRMNQLGFGIPRDLPEYSVLKHVPIMQSYFDTIYPNRYRLVIFNEYGIYRPVWKGSRQAQFVIAIYHEDKHFYGIRNINSFHGVKNYCVDCEVSYDRASRHTVKCKAKCNKCCGIGLGFPCQNDPPPNLFFKECDACHKFFNNCECFKRHKDKGVCKLFCRCIQCGIVYRTDREARGDRQHQCDIIKCRECNTKHHKDQGCYVQRIRPKTLNYILVIFDFECTTHTPVIDKDLNVDEHQRGYVHCVNCVSAMVYCSTCLDEGQRNHEGLLDKWIDTDSTTGECQICGGWSEVQNLKAPSEDEQYNQRQPRRRMMTWITNVNGYRDALKAFVDWIINVLGNGRNRKEKTIAIGHYAGRYDIHLLAGLLYTMGGLCPKIMRSGNKIYELRLERKNGVNPCISFRDSFNWMPLKLAELPKTMGLNVIEKKYFPHKYNRPENIHIVRQILPPKDDYCPQSMGSISKRQAFDEWYDENANTQFCLRDALQEYCENDVLILAQAVVRYRSIFQTLAREPGNVDDVIANSLTIASACIRHFCINFIEAVDNRIAIVPDQGYMRRDNQSVIALKFLKWYAHEHDCVVQHRDSAEGEFRLEISSTDEIFRLDGYVRRSFAQGRETPYRDLCIEFNGCAWHGHSCLYSNAPLEELCPNGRTAQKNIELFERRKKLIEQENLDFEVFWECDVRQMLEENAEMRIFFDSIRDTSTCIVPRDAFFGGRTGPLSLCCDLEEMSDGLEKLEISYFDIVSLYPYTNFTTEYPIGHPEVVVVDAPVQWSKPEDHQYRGLLKVFVVPPRDLLLPVLPLRVGVKLMFPLCRLCALQAEKGQQIKLEAPLAEWCQQRHHPLCMHEDENDRGFVIVATHLELNLALSRGYIVTHCYSVYNWSEWSSELFRPYFRQMLKIKIESSDWPKSVIGECAENENSVLEREALKERKRNFIERNRQAYGIELDEQAFRRNDGMRYISKLCNNSLWGRWGLRTNLTKDLITDNPMELHRLLNDPKVECGAVEMFSPKIFAVPYRKHADFVKSHDKYNIVLALFTTAGARKTLYEYMEKVVKAPGHKLLYTDTDSVIYVHPRGIQPPFKVGDYLGQMSKEYPEHEILAYYSGGCKQYGLKIRNKKTGKIEHMLRCRGCTLDSTNEDQFNFDNFKEMVKEYGMNPPNKQPRVTLTRDRFRPNFREGSVKTIATTITYSPICDKGVLDSALNVYPYGYNGAEVKSIH